ncbi:peptidylprolyl isomerase [Vibrio hippocampi]|uniref:peptidylprolyl isomerase n=1 Tax=Vibrio hippocampi TaxID=654686 RepID=A0ABN8DN71_9VIBR|nr:peptidylprolyl isomerase [Vibrio hippocampi]CAH0529319.1 Chaperone SurA [Vibrio hippocampi]
MSNNQKLQQLDSDQSLAYQKLKVAQQQFGVNPQSLTTQELQQVDRLANHSLAIQQKICRSPEARLIHIDEEQVNQTINSLVEQCGDIYQFQLMLNKHQISESALRLIVKQELVCDTALELVSGQIPPLAEQDALDYYHKHLDKFSRKRTWKVSQILITINNDFAENRAGEAKKRIEQVYQQANADNFPQLALKYSECPSAVEGGQLGWCEQGKLFNEIESVLQWLPKGVVSAPIQTEVGYHIVVCHEEKPEQVATFEQAYPSIEELHSKRAKTFLQKAWIAELK